MDTFLGRPVKYWCELQIKFDKEHARPLETADLLEEIALLRAKVSYYEDRIRQMAAFAKIGIL